MSSLKTLGTTFHPPGALRRPARILAWFRPVFVLGAVLLFLQPASSAQGKSPAARWKALTDTLLGEYYQRHPDQAFERGWPGAAGIGLGTHGTRAADHWGRVLEESLAQVEALAPGKGLPRAAAAQRSALEAWLQAEQLLLATRDVARTDPCPYVERATRALLSVLEASWLPEERRAAKQAELLKGLPDYFRDARTSLVAPCPLWIDRALPDLDELEDLIQRLTSLGEKPRNGRGKAAPDAALSATSEFRRWLLDRQMSGGNSPSRFGAGEWQRLVQLVSGTELDVGQIKASALRDLASTDPRTPADDETRTALLGSADALPHNVWLASARALELGKRGGLLRTPLEPDDLEVVNEVSPRSGTALALQRLPPTGPLRLLLELPSPTWSRDRVTTRVAFLQPRFRVALGLRYGLAGEALLSAGARSLPRPLAAALPNRAVQEGLGLFAMTWVPRVEGKNPYADDEDLLEILGILRSYEASRLLAALELHAEGLPLGEAALAFSRRTGTDRDTAQAEVLEALHDPLTGIGYLGWMELLGLRESLPGGDSRRSLALTLLLTTRQPEVRSADLRRAIDRRGGR